MTWDNNGIDIQREKSWTQPRRCSADSKWPEEQRAAAERRILVRDERWCRKLRQISATENSLQSNRLTTWKEPGDGKCEKGNARNDSDNSAQNWHQLNRSRWVCSKSKQPRTWCQVRPLNKSCDLQVEKMNHLTGRSFL